MEGSIFNCISVLDFAEHMQLDLWKPTFQFAIDHRYGKMFPQVIVEFLMHDQEVLFLHFLSFTEVWQDVCGQRTDVMIS